MNTCFDLSQAAQVDIHGVHVNFRPIESGYGAVLDSMVAALGNFSIYVSPIAGEASLEQGRTKIRLDKVGFHVMDSFDFEGSQSLGYWDEDANRVETGFFFGGTSVSNESFREWRARDKKGGDFLVYSDVKIVTLNPPSVFIV